MEKDRAVSYKDGQQKASEFGNCAFIETSALCSDVNDLFLKMNLIEKVSFEMIISINNFYLIGFTFECVL